MNRATLETNLLQHLQYLCVELGARPRGSASCSAAAAHIRRVFTAAGLEVEEQPFDCLAWDDETLLDLNGMPAEAVANPFSRPCDVLAATVAAGTIAALEGTDL